MTEYPYYVLRKSGTNTYCAKLPHRFDEDNFSSSMHNTFVRRWASEGAANRAITDHDDIYDGEGCCLEVEEVRDPEGETLYEGAGSTGKSRSWRAAVGLPEEEEEKANGDLPAYTIPEGANCNQVWGLTKRELFAGMAMQGILSSDTEQDYEELADSSVRQADALLAELAKEQG